MGLVVALPKVKPEPFKVVAPVLLPKVSRDPDPEARVVFPVEDKVVKAAVPGVVTPILVAFTPSE